MNASFKKAWVRAKEGKEPSFHYRGTLYDTASGERNRTQGSSIKAQVDRRDAARKGEAEFIVTRSDAAEHDGDSPRSTSVDVAHDQSRAVYGDAMRTRAAPRDEGVARRDAQARRRSGRSK
jgi:hypothetical protein